MSPSFVIETVLFLVEKLLLDNVVLKVPRFTIVLMSDCVGICRKAQVGIKLSSCWFIHLFLCPFVVGNSSSSEPISKPLHFATDLAVEMENVGSCCVLQSSRAWILVSDPEQTRERSVLVEREKSHWNSLKNNYFSHHPLASCHPLGKRKGDWLRHSERDATE